MTLIIAVIILFFFMSLAGRKPAPSSTKSDSMFGLQDDGDWVDELEILDIIDGDD